MSEKEPTGDHFQVTIGGPVSGQVAIGKNIKQTQHSPTVPSEAAPEVSPEEIEQLRQALADMKARVEAEAPPEVKDKALERVGEREEEGSSEKPDPSPTRDVSSPRLPGDVKLLTIVIASPGDVQAERDAIEGVVKELNHGVAADRGLRLEVVRWETDAHPGFHPKGPQGLIDPILRIEDSDVLIGIFWRRFGTPTSDARSGTEHEIRKAYAAWQKTRRPQIMVYFNQQPYTPTSKAETDQWGQVLTFKNEFPKEGLWWEYAGLKAFGDLIRNHLTQHIRQQYALPGQS